jgi:hypothetical protein
MNLSSATSSVSCGCAHSGEQSTALIAHAAVAANTGALPPSRPVDIRAVSGAVTLACVAMPRSRRGFRPSIRVSAFESSRSFDGTRGRRGWRRRLRAGDGKDSEQDRVRPAIRFPALNDVSVSALGSEAARRAKAL